VWEAPAARTAAPDLQELHRAEAEECPRANRTPSAGWGGEGAAHGRGPSYFLRETATVERTAKHHRLRALTLAVGITAVLGEGTVLRVAVHALHL
jgi:hypothetical protein